MRTTGRHCEELAVTAVTGPPVFVLIDSDRFILNESDASQPSDAGQLDVWAALSGGQGSVARVTGLGCR
jgi:hypothetical protein